MITKKEKYTLIVKVIVIMLMATLLLYITRFFPLRVDDSSGYNGILYEMLYTIFFAFILAFVLYLMTRKEFLKIYTRVQKYALTDALTGLKNRYFLIDYFETFAKDSEDDTEFSVVVINIDYFRKVNEAYGYVVGDCILKELSKKLTLLVEPKDIVCRYAGEEFVIVFENIGLPEIFDKVEFIREEIQNMIFECERKNITVSIGISVSRQKPKISQKLQEADLALYMAKKDGRNCVKVFPN